MINYSALGQAIDTTWGRSSTPLMASHSVKMSMLPSDRLLISYMAIINFASEKEMIVMKRSCEEEAKSVIAAHVKHVKSLYKDISGESLKLKEVSDPTDSLEIINFNVHNPKRSAYYRCKVVMEMA